MISPPAKKFLTNPKFIAGGGDRKIKKVLTQNITALVATLKNQLQRNTISTLP
jgi:hypothetical protein